MNDIEALKNLQQVRLKLHEITALNETVIGYLNDKILSTWNWPRNPRRDKIEYDCPHGIGHAGVHGCDGCCSHKSYDRVRGIKNVKRNRR